MKSKSSKVAITFCIFFVSFFIHSNVSLAFDELTTHPSLTDEIIDFYNLFSVNKLTSEEKETIISGAMSEDIPPRWINHFYDPIRNIGWTGRNTGIWPTSFMRYFSGTVLSSTYPVSSLNWLHNQELQTYYKMYKGNRTWERAIYEYANGNKQESFYTLGYILHLIEDATVPDHTRDDPHAHDLRWATGDYGSPLEEYAKRFTRDNFNIAAELKNKGHKPIILNSVDDYLIALAKYSNGYFFSKDTINDPVYQNPKIIKEDGKFGYGKDNNGEEFNLVKVTKIKIDKYNTKTIYSIFEEKGEEVLMPSYFSRLSREAIIHGAGVVDLFFKETEAIRLGQKQAPKLFVEEDKNIVRRVVTLDIGLGNISATGEFFKVVNLGKSVYGAVSGVVAEVYNATSGAVSNIAGLVFQKSNQILDTKNSNTGALATAIGVTNNLNIADLPAAAADKPASNLANAAIDATVAVPVAISEDRPLIKQAPSRSLLVARRDLDGVTAPAKSSNENAVQPTPVVNSQPAALTGSLNGLFFGGGGGAVFSSSNSADLSSQPGPSAGDQTGLTSSSSSLPASSSSADSSSVSSASDTTPPAAPIVTIPFNFSQTFTNANITFSGMAEAESVVFADFNSATTTANSSGDWSLTLSLAQGTTTINFFATDFAGNISNSTSAVLFVDSLAPVISSFSISQCQQSLSSDGCLIATTTANLIWASSSNDLDYFELTKNGTVSTTTATSTALTLPDNSSNFFSIRAKDRAGNWSAPVSTTSEISLTPVIINEVAWAGTGSSYSDDEWIELFNRTSKTVNLNNFVLYSQTDNSPYINLSKTIPSKGYFLIERKTDAKTSSQIFDDNGNSLADLLVSFSHGLSNNGEVLVLSYASSTIDKTILCGFGHVRWCPGFDYKYRAMERINPNLASDDASNWHYNNQLIINGKNAGGENIIGTPKARNSLSYLINKGQDVSSNLTLYASSSPYFVNGIQKFTDGSILAIEPGVVIKFNSDSGFGGSKSGFYFIDGSKLSAVGSSVNPIIFTSFYDDSYGGDINGGIGSSSPAPGDWFGVKVDSPGSESIISRAIFRYGGWYYGGSWADNRANLYLNGSSAVITNSIFEYGLSYGLKLVNSNSVVSGNVFRYNSSEGDSSGLYALGGGPQINSNSFFNNKKGLQILNLNSDSVINSNNFSSNADMAVYSSGKFGSLSNNTGSGNGVDGILIGDVISSAGATTTLTANSLPYIFNDFATVAASSTLNIGSGVIIKGGTSGHGSGLVVRGNLIITGTSSSDIIFSTILSQPQKGSWGGILLYPGSYSNISGATFEYADVALAYHDSSPINLSNINFYENNLAVSGSIVQLVNSATIEFVNNTATTSPGGLW